MTLSFDSAMEAFRPGLPLLLAFSGGADSTALLLACAAKWPGQVRAAHVHHGLQPAADDFADHCARVCAGLGVPLAIARVDARNSLGESPEDAARRARYASLGRIAIEQGEAGRACDIALAQHADDQAETLLLALTRGTGLAGLSAMPARWQRRCGDQPITLHRPLLRVGAADIRAWLGLRDVQFVEDPSNRNEELTRNRIRARLMPALATAFPAFLDTFARSAAHAAQAQELLREIAAADLVSVRVPPELAALQVLSRPRQANLLRHWLKVEHRTAASTGQLEELLRQVDACRTAAQDINIRVGQGFARRSGAHLDWRADGV